MFPNLGRGGLIKEASSACQSGPPLSNLPLPLRPVKSTGNCHQAYPRVPWEGERMHNNTNSFFFTSEMRLGRGNIPLTGEEDEGRRVRLCVCVCEYVDALEYSPYPTGSLKMAERGSLEQWGDIDDLSSR